MSCGPVGYLAMALFSFCLLWLKQLDDELIRRHLELSTSTNIKNLMQRRACKWFGRSRMGIEIWYTLSIPFWYTTWQWMWANNINICSSINESEIIGSLFFTMAQMMKILCARRQTTQTLSMSVCFCFFGNADTQYKYLVFPGLSGAYPYCGPTTAGGCWKYFILLTSTATNCCQYVFSFKNLFYELY